MKAHAHTRRSAIKKIAGAAAIVSTTGFSSEYDRQKAFTLKGNINHSVARWCFRDFSVADLAKNAKEMGITSVEILAPSDFGPLLELGMTCEMSTGPGSISENINNPKLHDELVAGYLTRIDEVADAGFKKLIMFSGNRAGMDDYVGMRNCATAIKRIVGHAEKRGVLLCMELLNSKVNHRDYMCDHTEWGVALVDMVGSDHFKLLYDIYHMQIMEGDIIRNIQDYHDYFGHYHTAGNPGRNELDDTQEIYYPAIMRAIVETGYEGYVAHEFVPTRDPMTSLRQAVEVCDV
ncbi:MAG: TIM barrel protein [Rhodothermales bacterium]